MAAKDITQYFVYRWRYILGYSLLGILLAGLLVFAGLYVPGGISPEEMRTTVRSAGLSFSDLSTLANVNLPYLLLQSASFELFGISDFTIKLPSLIIGLFSALGLILLLKRWFKTNIAILASMIAVTTGQFLFIAQNGAPGIMYVFWPVAVLLLGTQVTRAVKFRFLWKILFTIAAALSLYTPLSIYPLIAVLLAIIFHPHLRHAVRRLKKWKVAICVVLFALLVAPLAYLITLNPQMGLTLLGIPATFPPDIMQNLTTLGQQYFSFWTPSTTTLMTPVFGLGSVLIIGLGLYRLIRTRETTRSYLIIFWIICLLPILIIDPRYTSVVFVPAVLLLAAGLTSLVYYWYRLFPLNPYARIAGLIPLTILVMTLIGSGIDRYIYGYHYDPNTATNFSRDLALLPKDTTQLVVSEAQQPFFTAVSKYRDNLTVSTTAPTTDAFTTTRDAKQDTDDYEVTQIITTTYRNEADRLYVYQKTEE